MRPLTSIHPETRSSFHPAAMRKPHPRSLAFSMPAEPERMITAVATPEGKRRRSRSIICLRRGMMSTTPSSAPAMPPRSSGATWKESPAWPSLTHLALSMNSAGRVKMIPVPAVLMPDAMVWLMLFSIIVPFFMTPRRRA